MLFVPDEDYVRLPDHTGVTGTTTAAAAAVDDDARDEDEDDDVSVVSASIVFASQAQYLGHSNQVSLIVIYLLVARENF